MNPNKTMEEKTFKSFKKFLSEECWDQADYGDGKYDKKIFKWFSLPDKQEQEETPLGYVLHNGVRHDKNDNCPWCPVVSQPAVNRNKSIEDVSELKDINVPKQEEPSQMLKSKLNKIEISENIPGLTDKEEPLQGEPQGWERQIENILSRTNSGYGYSDVNKKECVYEILSLFQSTMKEKIGEIIGEDEKEILYTPNSRPEHYLTNAWVIARNAIRAEQRRRAKGILGKGKWDMKLYRIKITYRLNNTPEWKEFEANTDREALERADTLYWNEKVSDIDVYRIGEKI